MIKITLYYLLEHLTLSYSTSVSRFAFDNMGISYYVQYRGIKCGIATALGTLLIGSKKAGDEQ